MGNAEPSVGAAASQSENKFTMRPTSFSLLQKLTLLSLPLPLSPPPSFSTDRSIGRSDLSDFPELSSRLVLTPLRCEPRFDTLSRRPPSPRHRHIAHSDAALVSMGNAELSVGAAASQSENEFNMRPTFSPSFSHTHTHTHTLLYLYFSLFLYLSLSRSIDR